MRHASSFRDLLLLSSDSLRSKSRAEIVRIGRRREARCALRHIICLVEQLEQRNLLAAAYLPPSYFEYDTGEFLTQTSNGSPMDIATAYLDSHASDLGLTATDLDNPFVTDEYTDSDTGLTHIYLRQQVNGLEVDAADLAITIDARGEIVTVGGGFVPGLSAQLSASGSDPIPEMSALDAVGIAAQQLGLTQTSSAQVLDHQIGGTEATTIAAPGVSVDAISARLHYVPTEDGSATLAWELIIRPPSGENWFDLSVPATNVGQSTWGNVIVINDWVDHDSYNVIPPPNESPQDGGFVVVSNPADPVASPFGWNDTNGIAGPEFTDTRGNNVDAHLDRNNDNIADPLPGRPNGGPGLDFSGFVQDPTLEPTVLQNQNVAQVNLYYINNIVHDIHYQYGFTEAAGNFQVNNYGRGGLGSDAVQADAQDGGGTNNANFSTPADGLTPRMQMYLFTNTTPQRDGDLDNSVVIHEYGHGVSNRLTGGPANANALSALQSGGMGEGWSDFYALMFLQRPADVQGGAYPMGTYVEGQAPSGPGIRQHPYSYDMLIDPHTWNDFGTATGKSIEVHDTGEIWTSALWDMNWLLINKYGYDSNLYTGWSASPGPAHAGNKLALRLVMDAMKLQPANPTFVQARDAIIAADNALNDGADLFEIWSAFARRGLGETASTSSSSSTTVTTNFAVPAYASNLGVVTTAPAVGSIVSSVPLDYAVNFSYPFVTSSLSASDFAVDGVPATSFTITGTRQVIFHYNSSPFSAQGLHTMSMAAGALLRASDNTPSIAFSGQFRYDAVPLVVTSTAPAAGGIVALPGPQTFDVNFNEAITPTSVQTTDLVLSGVPGASVTAVTVLSGNTTARFTLSGSPAAEGTMTASIAAGAITDAFGNPGNSFSASYVVDLSTSTYPTPLTAKLPQGSLIYDPTVSGVINYAGDADLFTLALDPGQTISVLVTPGAPNLYGGVGNGGINPGSLLTVNQTTGAGTLVADPITPGGLSGLVFDPSSGLLLGSTIGNTDGISTLVTLDPASGALLSTIGAVTDGDGGPAMSIGDFALQPTTNTLYAVRSNADGTFQGGKLYTVNKTTGVATFVGSTGSGAGGGIAFAPDGSLYQTGFNNGNDFFSLNKLDPATAGRLITVPLTQYYDGLAIRPTDGQVFAATGGANDQIYMINITTGAATLVGSTGAGSTSDLAFGGLQPSVTVRDPSNLVLGMATASGLNQKSLLETVPATSSGAYSIVVSGAGGTIGSYTVQVILNAALESEGALPGATNDTQAAAENIAASFLTLSANQSASQRAAVLGGNAALAGLPFSTSDFETGEQGYTVNNNIRGTGASAGLWHLSTRRGSDGGHSPFTSFYYGSEASGTYNTGAANAGTITSAPFVVPSGGSVSFSYVLQSEGNSTSFDLATVQVSNNGGSTFTTIASSANSAQLPLSSTWRTAAFDLSSFGGQTILVRFSFDTVDAFSNSFEGWYVDDVTLLAPPNWTDYYAFTATANDKVSVAMKQLTGSGVSVLIENSSGTVLASGASGSTNYDQGVSNLLITDPGTNTYYLRVSGAGAATYSAIITKNAAFDTEPNDSISAPQNIDGVRTALGYVASSLLYGATKGAQLFTVNLTTGAGTLVGTLPITPTEIEFDNVNRRAFAQANDGSFFGREFNITTGAGIGSNINNGASFTGLEWVGSTLYGTAFTGLGNSTLRTLNPFTGASTTIGSTGFGAIAGLAYDTTTGIMYGITGGLTGTLVTVNLATGAATTVGATGFRAGSLEFGPDGLLYGGGTGPDENRIFRINKATGASTLVGQTGIGVSGTRDVTGLATVLNDTDDWYSIDVSSLATFRLETSTPADGANQFVNTLNPHIELYDPSNNLVPVATGVALADGRNESILYTPAVTGTFRVHITAEGGTSGEYVVSRSSVLYWDADGIAAGNNIATGAGLGGSGTWDTSGGKWFDGANDIAWTNSNNTAIFTGSAGAVTVGTPITAGALTFNTTGYSITGGTLTLAGVGQVNVGSTLSATISSQLSGSVGPTATGPGTLVLSNSGNNYTGATTISSGTLQLGAANSIPSTSAVSLANVVGVTLNLNGFSDTIGSLAGGGTTGGSVTLGSGTLTTGGNNASTTFSGVLSGTGGALTKNGTGTFTLGNVNNTFTGQTTINAGTLTIASVGSLNSTSAILIGSSSPATLAYNSSGGSTAKPITINGSGGGAIQTLVSGGTLTLTGPINNAGNPLTFDVNAGSITVTGVISGAGGVTKNNTGTLTLSNATNTFSGQLTVNAGTLSFASAGGSSLGTGAVNPTILLGSSSAATLIYTGGTGTTGRPISINGAGGGTIQASASGTLTLTGGISTNGNPITFNANLGNITETGAITDGGTLTKTGGSIVTLSSAANSFGNTTITAGTLQAGVANAIPASSAVSMTSSNATLNLNNLGDTIGSLSNSNLAPLNVTTSGSGYTSTPTLVFSGGGGSGAAGTGLLGVVNANLLNGGSGYSAAPTINFSSPSIVSGVTGSGTTTLTSGAVTAVTINGAGSGYSAPPNVVISAPGGSGTTATGTANLRVVSVSIANGGLGYTSAPTVTFSAPPSGGATATGTANVVGGTVTSITITVVGSGYTSVPTITLTGGGFTIPASATALMGINAVTLTSGGSGYSAAPLVTFSSPSTATGFVTMSGGSITGITIVNRGSGYLSVPSITFNNSGFGGTGATASAVLGVVGTSLTNTGTGYTSPPTAGFSGGGVGTGAAATALLATPNVRLGTGTLTTGGDNISTTFNGVISGFGNLTKTGAGKFTIGNAANSYSGATNVNAGSLLVTGNIATSATTVNSGGTLGGTGTTDGITVNSGGTLAPGLSPGILNTGSITLSADSVFRVELNGPSAGSGYDQANVTGTVALNGATLNASLGFIPDVGVSFLIINNDGTDPVIGTFSGLPEGALFTPTDAPPGQQFQITYTGGTGSNSVVLTHANTAPVVTSLIANPSLINEGDSTTLSGAFTDPDQLDTHTVVIDWGDGSPQTTLNLPPGVLLFGSVHQYLDDSPTGTPSDVSSIVVTVTDNHGTSGSNSTSVTVNNVAPTNVNLVLSSTSIQENGTVTVNGTFTDPGTLDTHTVVIDWNSAGNVGGSGEGTTTLLLPAGVITFTASHQYLDDNPTLTPSDTYSIHATVTDDDGEVDNGLFTTPPTLYAVDGSSGNPAKLYQLDPTTGAVISTIGPIGFNHVTDIDFNPLTGQLYGIVSNFFAGQTALLSIDVNTGAGTLIGPTGAQIPDMSFNSTGTLYAWSEFNGSTNDDLGTVDLATGAFNDIGGSLVSLRTGLAFDSSDHLFLKIANTLYTLDPATGEQTGPALAISTPLTLHNILEFGSGDVLYSASRTGVGATLVTIDPTTAAAATFGSNPLSNLSGLAFRTGLTLPTTKELTVKNVVPSNLAISLSATSINENDSTTLTGTFKDPGTLDTHTVTIDWGDGSPDTVINLGAGVLSVPPTSHQYVDDGPSPGNGTPSDAYSISVTISDDDGGTATSGPSVQHELIVNGGFETGDLTGWTVLDSGFGSWSINNGTFVPPGLGTALPPISGNFDVVSSQSGPSLSILSSPIVVPPNVTSAVLSWQDRIRNYASVFSDPDQEWRVLILNGSGGLIQEVYSTNPGDPLQQVGPNSRAFDLTPLLQSLEGQTIQISFQQQDDLFFFNASLDDVSLQVGTALPITVNNVDPVIDTLLATSVDENGVVHLIGSYHDIGSQDTHMLTINWGEGLPQTVAVGEGSFDIPHQYLDDNPTGTASDSYTIGVTLSDDDTGTDAGSTTTTITNVAPEITSLSLSSTSINEGSSTTLTINWSDPGTQDTYTVKINWGDDSDPTILTITPSLDVISVGASATGSSTLAVTHLYADDGPSPGNGTPSDVSTIQVTVEDDDGGSDSDQIDLTVNNVAPTLSAITGVPLTDSNDCHTTWVVTGTFSDPGTDTYKFVINWGDNSSDTFYVPGPGLPGFVGLAAVNFAGTASHTYTSFGTFSITVSVTDDDGGTVTSATVGAATVAATAAVVTDPVWGKTLDIHGTDLADHITVNQNMENGALVYKVHADSWSADRTYAAAGVNIIRIHLCDGNDEATISSGVDVGAILLGEAGDDHLNAGKVASVVVGGDGDDVLIGGNGADMLIGGNGSDRIVGNASDDLLISSRTSYDANDAALKALLAVWNTGANYTSRVAVVQSASAPYHLLIDGPNQTVFSDYAVDILTGSAGSDLFLANIFADMGDDAFLDIITDLKSETALDIDAA